jgi:hypothetical protein
MTVSNPVTALLYVALRGLVCIVQLQTLLAW